jgi:hypothetical protein
VTLASSLRHSLSRDRSGRIRGAVIGPVLSLAGLLRQDGITVGELLDRLGHKGFGLALLILTLPTIVPTPGPVGMIFGSVIAVIALQVMVGARRLWLPGFLRRRTLPGSALRRGIAWVLPYFARAERLLSAHRLAFLTRGRARALLGIPVFILAVAIALPIPFGNTAPALALLVFALGFIARDGAAIAAALVLAVAAIAWTAFLFFAGASLFGWATA